MEARATEVKQGDTPPEVEKSMTKSHLKLVLFCLAVVCFALLLGGGAVYTSAIPTPRLSLANRWCDTPINGTYSYFTPLTGPRRRATKRRPTSPGWSGQPWPSCPLPGLPCVQLVQRDVVRVRPWPWQPTRDRSWP